MNACTPIWAALTLKAITALATVVVAVYVAIISKRQWKTNQEKLRLDLYEHRFDIYTRVLDFHAELIGWEDTEKQISLKAPFLKAFRESRFMFPASSGVHAFLHEFWEHSFQIVNFKAANEAWGECFSAERIKLIEERDEHVNWILGSMGPLEKKMAPFLNFHNL